MKTMASAEMQFSDVGPSSVQYFSLASAPGAPGLSLSLETAGGTPAGETAEPLITIVRTK